MPNRLLHYGRPADRDNQVIEFREVESRGTIDFFEGHGTDDLRIAIDVVEAKTMEDDVSDRVRDAVVGFQLKRDAASAETSRALELVFCHAVSV